jgi:hypothetical protein
VREAGDRDVRVGEDRGARKAGGRHAHVEEARDDARGRIGSCASKRIATRARSDIRTCASKIIAALSKVPGRAWYSRVERRSGVYGAGGASQSTARAQNETNARCLRVVVDPWCRQGACRLYLFGSRT